MVNPRYNEFNTNQLTERTGAKERADSERAYLNQQYQNILGGQVPLGGGGGSGEGEEDGGGGSGGGGAPADPFATSWGGFSNFANGGGVDLGKLEESLGGFRKISESGGFSPEQLETLKGISSGFAGVGKNPMGSYGGGVNDALGNLKNYSLTGGYDPTELADLKAQIAEAQRTGGMDPTQLGNIRGGVNNLLNYNTDWGTLPGRYNNLADTGGFSTGDIQNFRARATSGVPALYTNTLENMARQQALTGGSSNYGAQVRAANRDMSRSFTDASRGAEVDLASQIREGKLSGMAGLANITNLGAQHRIDALSQGTGLGTNLENALAQNKLRAGEGMGALLSDQAGNRLTASNAAATQGLSAADLEARNRLSALTGQRDTEMGQISEANRSRLAALTGITDTNYGAQNLVQQGRQFGVSGQFNVEQARQQAAEAAANRASAERSAGASAGAISDAARMQQERFALSGLQGLYGMGSGELDQYNSAFLAGQGQQDQTNLGFINAGLSPYQQQGQEGSPWWRKALGAAAAGVATYATGGAAAPAAGAIYGGIAG